MICQSCCLALALLVATGAQAAITPVTNVDTTPTYSSVTVGATTVTGLVTGTTTTFATVDSDDDDWQDVIDTLSLEFGVAGGNSLTSGDFRTVAFGGASLITDNDADPDFFVFEGLGNDPGTIQAVLADGSLGQAISFVAGATHWGGTGYTSLIYTNATRSSTASQEAFGMAFHFTDLLDAAGINLTPGTPIQGIFIDTAGALDAVSISANIEAVPEPVSMGLLMLGLLAAGHRRSGRGGK